MIDKNIFQGLPAQEDKPSSSILNPEEIDYFVSMSDTSQKTHALSINNAKAITGYFLNTKTHIAKSFNLINDTICNYYLPNNLYQMMKKYIFVYFKWEQRHKQILKKWSDNIKE